LLLRERQREGKCSFLPFTSLQPCVFVRSFHITPSLLQMMSTPDKKELWASMVKKYGLKVR
jgi:hypothetical protein